MKLFEKQDDQGMKRKSRTRKIFRRMKHKRERAAAKQNPDHVSTYGKYRGWVT